MENFNKTILEQINKQIILDIGSVLNKAIDVAAYSREKELVCDMLKHHESLNNELLIKIIDHSDKVLEKSIEFFEKRESGYLQAGKFAKVFGFKKWSSISNDAFYTALSDTQQLLQLTSPFENPAVQALIASRVQRQQALLSHLSNMLEQDPIKKLNFEGVNKILGL